MRKGVLLLFLFAIGIFSISSVSAEIFIGQLEGVYNLGDELSVDVTLSPDSSANDFLKINVLCDGESVEIYRNPFNLDSGEQVTIDVFALLSESLIGEVRGSCSLVASYSGESSSSQGFEITDQINVKLSEGRTKYSPGESVSMSGTALTKSGNIPEGFVEVKIDSLDISVINVVNSGDFSFNFTLPEDSLAGDHKLLVRVYEKDNLGDVGNQGEVELDIEIPQVLTGLEIEVDSQNINPGDTITFSVNARDQAENIIGEEITLFIYEPNDNVFSNKVIISGEDNEIEIEKSAIPGYWKIEASSDDEFSARKLFYVEEIEEIETSLIGDTLVITNTGNVPYEDPIEISIGSAVEVRRLSLGIGETKRFKLSAPEGEYSIGVNDGREEQNLGNVLLTGKAVGIDDIGESFGSNVSLTAVGIAILVILLFIVAYLVIRNKRNLSKIRQKGDGQKTGSALTHGAKEEASIVVIRTEAKEDPYVSATVERALTSAKHSGAKTYQDRDYRILILSRSLTRKKDNNVSAVKIAKRAEKLFKNHNDRFKNKIKFGICVSKGNIISEIKNKEFNFTTTDNMISKAKRIAHHLDEEVLLTDEIRRVVASEVKTEKVSNRDVWKISRIVDRGKHSDFIQKFKK